MGVDSRPGVKPKVHAPVPDTLIETGGALVDVVVVDVDSVNNGVDCARVAWGCETPIVRHGARVMGVV